MAAAGRTDRWRLVPGRTCASALIAGLIATDLDLGLLAECGFFEGERQIGTGISAPLRTPTTPAAGVHSEQVAEDVPEDIAEVGERRGIKSAEARTAVHAGMAKLVIALPLFGVDQNAVRFGALLELLLRCRIVRIAVRMILH